MILTEFVIVVVLLALNAFLAASEISIVSARPTRLRALAEEGNQRAASALDLKANPSDFLATVQVGITVASFFASAVGAVSIVALLAAWLDGAPLAFVRDNAGGIALVVVTAILSFLSIVLGELVPKTIAVQRAESVALAVVRPIRLLSRLSAPLVSLLTGTTNLLLRLLGVHQRAQLPSITQDELRALIETAQDEGVVPAGEADLLEDVFDFGDTDVRQVMVPRVDVAALDADTPLREAMDRFFSTGYSRLPVYRETPDAVIGILYVKDAARLLLTHEAAPSMPVADFVRPAFFVPESKPIDELLAELRRRRTHIAIVVDEFGGTAGLVTLEDLLEELVGEITDEFDPGYEPFREVAPGTLEVDGRVAMPDLLDRLDLEPADVGPFEAESVGGLIADAQGRIPRVGDTVQAGVLRLTVLSMIGRRVGRVLVEVVAPA